MIITINNHSYNIDLKSQGNKLLVTVNQTDNYEVAVEFNQLNELQTISINNKKYWVNVKKFLGRYIVNITDTLIEAYVRDSYNNSETTTDYKKLIKIGAPMSGLVIKLSAKIDQDVKKNEHLMTIEAMKMQNEILSPIDGRVIELNVKEGETVEKDQKLITIQPVE
ncbi:MAG: acetyl-CoA carboxylase biotin carboxyl carrier protein subunit [candidate division WOR-3 bacterium]